MRNFLLLLSIVSLHSQTRYRYLDTVNKPIDAVKFAKDCKTRKTTKGYTANDSTIVFKIVKRESTGKLDAEKFNTLKNFINLSRDKDFWIFVYYPGVDECNDTGRQMQWDCFFEHKHQVQLAMNGDYELFWIAKTEDENIRHLTTRKVHWRFDSRQFFEKTFFDCITRASASLSSTNMETLSFTALSLATGIFSVRWQGFENLENKP